MKYETLTDVVQQSFATTTIKFNLDKIQIHSDEKILSYIRGFIWRKYKVRIKFPLDAIILFIIQDVRNIVDNNHTKKVENIIETIKKFPLDAEWESKEILEVIGKEYLLLV